MLLAQGQSSGSEFYPTALSSHPSLISSGGIHAILMFRGVRHLWPVIELRLVSWRGATSEISRSNRADCSVRRLALVAAVALLLSGCQPAGQGNKAVPEIPNPSISAMSDEARELIGTARDRVLEDPADPLASGRFGMACHAYELREEAIACYRRAAILDPGDWRWPYYVGALHAETGSYDRAASRFREALVLQPDSLAARIRLGEALLEGARFAESAEVFEEAVARWPESAAGHFGLGRTLQADGDGEGALRAYQRSADLAPEAGAVRYSLALVYRELGKHDDAERELAMLPGGNRSEPPLADPLMAAVQGLRADKHQLLGMGLALEADGRLGEAAATYEKAVEIDAGYLQARVNLVAAYGKLGRFADAATHYAAALEIDPGAEELHMNWGMLQATRKQFAEAAESYRRALEANPLSADAHADLAVVLDEVADTEGAIRHFKAALELEPVHRPANFHLARHLVARGRIPEAVEHLLNTRQPVDERTPTYLYGLADAYLRSGDLPRAIRYGYDAAALARGFGQVGLAAAIEEDMAKLEAVLRR